jgi:hypothetical protein
MELNSKIFTNIRIGYAGRTRSGEC